jgi:hypothetical protein
MAFAPVALPLSPATPVTGPIVPATGAVALSYSTGTAIDNVKDRFINVVKLFKAAGCLRVGIIGGLRTDNIVLNDALIALDIAGLVILDKIKSPDVNITLTIPGGGSIRMTSSTNNSFKEMELILIDGSTFTFRR